MPLDVIKAEDDWTINTSSYEPRGKTLKFLGITREQYNRSEEERFYPLPKPSLPEDLIP